MSDLIKFHGWLRPLDTLLRLIGLACFLTSLAIVILWLYLGLLTLFNPLLTFIWIFASTLWLKYFTYTSNNLIFNVYLAPSEFQHLMIMLGILVNLSVVLLFSQKEINHLKIEKLPLIASMLSPIFSVSIVAIRRHLYRTHTLPIVKVSGTSS